jgi:hypothetical protein
MKRARIRASRGDGNGNKGGGRQKGHGRQGQW